MKSKPVLIAIFLLFVLSLMFPWFTYNPKIMGYCWGFQFVNLWLAPVIIIGIYVFWKSTTVMFALCELSLVAMLGSYIFAFGKWQESCNIISGFQWEEGLYTATIGYWVSLGLFVAFTILCQFCAVCRGKSEN